MDESIAEMFENELEYGLDSFEEFFNQYCCKLEVEKNACKLFELFDFCIENYTTSNYDNFFRLKKKILWVYNPNILIEMYKYDYDKFMKIFKHIKLSDVIDIMKNYIQKNLTVRHADIDTAFKMLDSIKNHNIATRIIYLLEQHKFEEAKELYDSVPY